MAHAARRALVTGANRGIGQAICRSLTARGDMRIVAAARRRVDAEAAAAELGRQAAGVELDLSNPDDAQTRVREIDKELGPIDILINNAGIMSSGRGLDCTPAELAETLAVNSVAPFALIRALAPGMQSRGWGRIVNLSSGWGSFDQRFGGPLAYSVSKATLNALTVTVAESLDPCVKVNAVCPGWVRTRMGGRDARRSPEEAADTPVWLATLPDDGPSGGFFRRRQRIPW
jgi:NAD(P)-dependent dehydrogenase (short-subunit alcohol dehydrogenase family)